MKTKSPVSLDLMMLKVIHFKGETLVITVTIGKLIWKRHHIQMYSLPFLMEDRMVIHGVLIRQTYISVHLPTTTSTQIFLKTFCPNITANYTANSTFGMNLNLLFSSLASNASLGFSNGMIGENPNRVYGHAECRGDTAPDVCRDCINTASQELLANCPNRTGITWYDKCLLRYSDQPISSSPRNRPLLIIFYEKIPLISDRVRFNVSLGQLMNDLATRAAFGPSSRMYATGETSFTNFQSIYGLMQCTNDLSRSDCNLCLRNTTAFIPTCCDGRYGVRLVGVSCNLRFDMFKFYDDLAIAPAPSHATPALIPPLTNTTTTRDKKSASGKVLTVVIPVVITFVLICTCLLWKARRKSDDQKSLIFDFGTLRAATNDFSDANKLGEGGFGPVYKGKLMDGQEIAVKRLSQTSGQGAIELINEVALLTKIQHNNLVRLLGCCLEKQEKMLVYEFLPNTSLDSFLFDPIKRLQLNWEKRYKIIIGIARGLMYLHEDSPLRIIHRDLKASNILLDHDLNPKIADFGLAKLFGGDQTQGNTIHIAGTYGYMPPEYAMDGKFSTKLDVFSFGVLVLEIVTGRKNAGFREVECATNLLSYAWGHWTEGTALQIVDRTLGDQCPTGEVLRCIHMGLLCVQEDASQRPSISSAVLMLESYSVTFPLLAQPAFCNDCTNTPSHVHAKGSNLSSDELDQSTDKSIQCSANEVTITELEPR